MEYGLNNIEREIVMLNHIEIRNNRDGQPRAFIKETRIRVQDIAMDHEYHGMSVDEIASNYPHISLSQIYAALSYYFEYRDEIWLQIKEDEKFVNEMKQKFQPLNSPT